MGIEIAPDFTTLAKELAALNTECGRLKAAAMGLADRAAPIIKQHKRNTPVRDTAFEEEFRAFIAAVSAFANQSDSFWKTRMSFIRTSGAAALTAANHMGAAALLAHAMQTHKDIAAFCNSASYLHTDGKALPLRLNWFSLETSCNDLEKLSSKVALLVRELSKHVKDS